MKISRRVIGAGLVGLVVVGGLVARSLRGVELPVVAVESRRVVQTLVSSGRVRANGRGVLSSAVVGKVIEDHCRPGQRVAAGTLLYRLRDEEQQANVAEARARVAQASARLGELLGPSRTTDVEAVRQAELALLDAEEREARLGKLLAEQAVDRVTVDEARRATSAARSRLEAARSRVRSSEQSGSRSQLARAELEQTQASLRLAEARLWETRLVAPQAGVISACDGVVGAVVTPGSPLCTLVLDGPVEIVIEPDEKNLGVLALGQRAQVSADAFPERVFTATVSTIVGAVDPVRGTVEVRLTAAEPPPFLVSELTVSVELEVASAEGARVVPRAAVRELASAPWVWVLDGGRAVRRSVRLGLRGDAEVQVLDGLTVGERVIVPGAKLLEAGARVVAAPVAPAGAR